MTVESTDNRAEYTGNGSTTEFSFRYLFLSESDLVVLLDGTEQTLNSDYTVTGAEDPNGGTVEFTTAPADGADVIIFRDPEILQPFDLVENDSLPAEEAERAWDRITLVAQRLRELVTRSFRLSDAVESGVDVQVPAPEASTLIGWNADGDALTNREVDSLDGVMVGTAPDEVPTNADADSRGFSQQVDSIAGLRAGSFPDSLDRIWLSGYHGVGTPGGGNFYADRSDTTTVDNSGTVIVDADGVRWKRVRKQGELWSDWFGCGKTGDVSTEMQAFFDESMTVRENEGSVVLRIRGEITLGSTVTHPDPGGVNSQTIFDAEGAVISVDFSGLAIDLNGRADPKYNDNESRQNTWWRGGIFELTSGTTKEGSSAIRLAGFRNAGIMNAHFKGFDRAIRFSDKDTLYFIGNKIFNCNIHIVNEVFGIEGGHIGTVMERNHHSAVSADPAIILSQRTTNDFVVNQCWFNTGSNFENTGILLNFTDVIVADKDSGSLQEGETITGGTSGATAVVLYLNDESSNVESGVVSLSLESQSGSFTIGETITGGTSGATAVVSGATNGGTTGRHTTIQDTHWEANAGPSGATLVHMVNRFGLVQASPYGVRLEGNNFGITSNGTVACKFEGIFFIGVGHGNVFNQGGSGNKSLMFDPDCGRVSIDPSSRIRNEDGVIDLNGMPRSELKINGMDKFLFEGEAIAGYDGDSYSSGDETIDMSAALNEFETVYGLPPKAYEIESSIRDSGAETGSVSIEIASSSSVNTGYRSNNKISGFNNSELYNRSIFTRSDGNGDIYVNRNASGTGTLSIVLTVRGIYY